MAELLKLILAILGTYRLTKLVMEDYILEDVRQFIFDKFPKKSKISYFFTCPWCISIWVATGLLVLRYYYPKIYDELVLMLTMSAATGIISTKI